MITPIGLFEICYILYRKDRVKNLKALIKKIPITKNMGWCNDSKSKKYNKIIKYPSNYSFEKLYRKDNVYDIILVLNYNMKPIRKNKGSAIFIHVAKKDYKPTEGCIAIKKKELIKIIQNLKRKTKVVVT